MEKLLHRFHGPLAHRSHMIDNLKDMGKTDPRQLLASFLFVLTLSLLTQRGTCQAAEPTQSAPASAELSKTTASGAAQSSKDSSAPHDVKTDIAPDSSYPEVAPDKQEKFDTQALHALQRREEVQRKSWVKRNDAKGLPERAEVLAITVAGGVSLGSYEAGQLYLLTEALRNSPGAARLMVASGASAGSANAIIAATDACRKARVAPEDSLGYRVWVNVGLNELYQPKRVTSESLFVRDAIKKSFNLIAKDWASGLPEECEFVFGLTATRQEGYQVELSEGLTVPRVTERFAVKVKGRTGKAPIFTNYLDPTRNYERPLLPLSEGLDLTGEQDNRAIQNAVLASASFPVAFKPVPIQYCVSPTRAELAANPTLKKPTCDQATRVDKFVDGGVFDNNPLSTTYGVASNGIIRSADGKGFKFRKIPNQTMESGETPEIVYGYIDPDLRTYQRYQPEKRRRSQKSHPLIGVLGKIGGQALSSARGQALADLAERNPEALSRLWLLEGNYPPLSDLIAAFFGFFEKDFRDFDFHLGLYDSYYSLREHTATMLGADPFLFALEEQLAGPAKEVSNDYRKLACLLSHFEGDRYTHLQPLCQGEKLQDFRILLQVTLDRLWSNCRLLNDDEAHKRNHLQCKRAHGGIDAPIVDPTFKVKGERYRGLEEAEFDYVLRIMKDYQFHFQDLGLTREQSNNAKIAVRRKLEALTTSLANAQPGFANRTLVMTAGRVFINRLAYEPAAHRWYVLLGSALAVGHLGRIGNSSAFYWNADARLNHLRSLITDRPNEFAGILSFGAEMALLPISGNILQTSIGARLGYQLTASDSIGIDPCTSAKASGDSRDCSQMVIMSALNFTLLERVRLSFAPVFYPIPESFGHKVIDIELGVGAEFF